jgi:phage gpG-like protein
MTTAAKIDVRPLHALVKRLYAAHSRAQTEKRPLARSIANALVEIAEHRVRSTKTAPDGTPWAPWADSYARTRGGQHSLLMDTRELLNSFEPYVSGAGLVAGVRNTADYAGYVQAKRPFLGIGPLEESAAEEAARDYLERLL